MYSGITSGRVLNGELLYIYIYQAVTMRRNMSMPNENEMDPQAPNVK